VEASGSIIKNVKSVIVPNTNHLKGIPAAATAGIIAGKAERELEVIAEVTPEEINQMKEFLETVPIDVKHIDQGITFDIVVTLYKGGSYAKVRIANYHTNIVLVEKDHRILSQKPVEGESEEGLTDRSLLDMEHIWDFINTVDVADVKEVLDRQIAYNTAISEEGLRGNYGANIGQVLLDTYGDDIRTRAKAKAAAGSDARMNGCDSSEDINRKIVSLLRRSQRGSRCGSRNCVSVRWRLQGRGTYGSQCAGDCVRNCVRRSESFLRGQDCIGSGCRHFGI